MIFWESWRTLCPKMGFKLWIENLYFKSMTGVMEDDSLPVMISKYEIWFHDGGNSMNHRCFLDYHLFKVTCIYQVKNIHVASIMGTGRLLCWLISIISKYFPWYVALTLRISFWRIFFLIILIYHYIMQLIF